MKTIFTVVVYGVFAAVAVRFTNNLTADTGCILVYLAMILGALMSIASILEDK